MKIQIFHIGALIEPLQLDKLLVFAKKGTFFEQSSLHHCSFSEHGGENSTCDSAFLKEPRKIALDFVQQKLHTATLNAAYREILDAVINSLLREENLISKPRDTFVYRSKRHDKRDNIIKRSDSLNSCDTKTDMEVIIEPYYYNNSFSIKCLNLGTCNHY